MAQVRIDECLLNDPRFKEGVSLLEKNIDILVHHEAEEMMLGKCWRAFTLAQKYWRDERSRIPKQVWLLQSNASFSVLMETVGLAKREADGIYLCGAHDFFDWYHTKSEAGKKGGIESGKSRKRSENKGKSKQAKQKREASEAETLEAEAVSVSVSASVPVSASVSVSGPGTKNSPNGERGTPVPPAPSLFEIWNANCAPLPKCTKLNDSRKRKSKARLTEESSAEYWERATKKMAASSFCIQGKWATLDWLIANDTNHVKVTEGKYDDAGGEKDGKHWSEYLSPEERAKLELS